MKIILCFVLAFFSPVGAIALMLDGTWKSDKDKTLTWNKEHRKVSDKYLQKLAYVLGHHYLTYDNGKSCNYFEAFEIKGKENEAYALPESSYQTIGKNDHGFVIEETLSTGEVIIFMVVFESENTFYGTMLDTEDYGQPGHREYYKRVKPIGNISWGSSSCYPK